MPPCKRKVNIIFKYHANKISRKIKPFIKKVFDCRKEILYCIYVIECEFHKENFLAYFVFTANLWLFLLSNDILHRMQQMQHVTSWQSFLSHTHETPAHTQTLQVLHLNCIAYTICIALLQLLFAVDFFDMR